MNVVHASNPLVVPKIYAISSNIWAPSEKAKRHTCWAKTHPGLISFYILWSLTCSQLRTLIWHHQGTCSALVPLVREAN